MHDLNARMKELAEPRSGQASSLDHSVHPALLQSTENLRQFIIRVVVGHPHAAVNDRGMLHLRRLIALMTQAQCRYALELYKRSSREGGGDQFALEQIGVNIREAFVVSSRVAEFTGTKRILRAGNEISLLDLYEVMRNREITLPTAETFRVFFHLNWMGGGAKKNYVHQALRYLLIDLLGREEGMDWFEIVVKHRPVNTDEREFYGSG